METRKIGSLEASVVGLGCNNFGWNIGQPGTANVIDAAIDSGITFFDTADIYGGTKSEQFLGRLLGSRRSKVILATKFGMQVDDFRQGARPEYVRQACDDSLKRLSTDYIDLYQIHRPDATVPISDTLGALTELMEAGKIREIGCSNFSAAQLLEAEAAVGNGARFVSVQNEYSLLRRDAESEVLPACEALGTAFIPYFPLACGLLTGKYRKGQPHPEGTRITEGSRYGDLLSERNVDAVESLIAFCESRSHTLLELAFSWLLSRPTVASVIAGATKADQVRANAAAAGWKLTATDLAEVDSILTGPPSAA
ncbi:MAG: aldo/keto reductase [Capsulimonadaceae bacterium]